MWFVVLEFKIYDNAKALFEAFKIWEMENIPE